MSKRYCIQWTEVVTYNSSVWIEAESEKEALDKWREGKFDDWERDESHKHFESHSEEICDVSKE